MYQVVLRLPKRMRMITAAKKYYLVALFSLASYPRGAHSFFLPFANFAVRFETSLITTVSACGTGTRSYLDRRCGLLTYRGGGKVPNRSISASLSISESVTKKEASKTMESLNASGKLSLLRSRMKELDLDVYLVPTDDPHLSGKFMLSEIS
jgi:hypothetical protein